MSDLEITPFKSIGPLIFGDHQLVARRKLASRFVKLTKGKPNDVDAFDELGLHLYYDEKGHVEFVEAFDPANVLLEGVAFIGRELTVLLDQMATQGLRPTETDEYGVKFGEAGIAIYAPYGVIEAVAAHRSGYYQR